MIHTISPIEMSKYVEQIFHNNKVLNFIGNSETPDKGSQYYETIAHILTNYYILTNDNSVETIEFIAETASTVGPQDDKEFFKQFILGKVLNLYASKLGQSSINLINLPKIFALIKGNCSNNAFYTHSFSGALYDEINANGLDINKEKFKPEYETLSKLYKTPFMKGKLNYCELSRATWSYAYGGPERLNYSIGGVIKPQEPGETKHALYERSLTTNLQKALSEGKINEQEYQNMYRSGMTMIDFYHKQKDICVAFFKFRSKEFNISETEEYYTNLFLRNISYFNNHLTSRMYNSKELRLQKPQITTINNDFSKVKELISKTQDSSEKLQIYNSFFTALQTQYPELSPTINDIITNIIVEIITSYLMRNYLRNGNADGYYFDNGTLPRNYFAIAKFTNPKEIVIDQYNFLNTSI